MKRRLLQRAGIVVAGFVLARFVPGRALRRLLLTVLPAVGAFAFTRSRARDRARAGAPGTP